MATPTQPKTLNSNADAMTINVSMFFSYEKLKARMIAMNVLRLFSRLVSFLFACKPTKKNMLSVDLDATHPCAPRFVPVDSFKAAFSAASNGDIHLILRSIRGSEVFYSVVGFFHIHMINLFRQITMMPKKNKAMLKGYNICSSYADRYLSVLCAIIFGFLQRSCNGSSFMASGGFFPDQSPFFGVIIKSGAQKILSNALSGKFSILHWMPLELNKQSLPQVNGVRYAA